MNPELNQAARQQLHKLQLLFHEQLPAKLDDIEQAFRAYCAAPNDYVALSLFYRLIHNLAGTAGTFGAQLVAQQALLLNNTIRDLLDQKAPASQKILDDLAEQLTATKQTARQWDPNGLQPIPQQKPGKNDSGDNNLIYIVEDDELLAQRLTAELEPSHYEIQHFTNTETFRQAYASRVPSIIIMDMIFEEGEYAGARVLQELKQTHGVIPPIIFISIRNDMEARLAAQRAGASRYFHKPFNLNKLHACVDGLTHHHVSDPFRVLVINDESDLGHYYCSVLEIAGIKTHYCSKPMQALQCIEEFQPELVLLDIYMPQVTGLEVAAVIRQDDRLAQMPIVFLASETNLDKQLIAMNQGGDEVLTRPIDAEHLIAAITARLKRSRWVNRMNTELKFALQEIEYRQIALDQHSIVSATDTEGNITEINHRFIEISGYSRAELIGKNHRLLSSGEHPKAFFEDMWSTITNGDVWHGEICNRAKDGNLYWVESTIVPFLDNDGLPYKYVSIRTDITDLMATQQALYLSEKDFRAIFNNIQDIFYQTDLAGRVTLISPSVEKHSGYTPSEIMSKDIVSLYVDPADREKFLTALEQNNGRISNYEIQMRRKNGGVINLSANSQYYYDDMGNLLGIEGTLRDITESKRIQLSLEKSEARLKRSQSFANIGTWDWDIQSGELFWSERIGPLFGYHKSIPETTYENFLKAVHPDDRDMVTNAVQACVADGKDYNIEHRVIWEDGSTHWMMEQGDVIRAADGTPLHMLGVVQDITHRKHAELALMERERQLREAQALAQLGSWQANLLTGELSWSDEIYRIFGHEPGSFNPSVEAFQAAVHPDDIQKVYESERLASETGMHDVIHRIVRPDGSIRHVHELAHGETDKQGNLIRLVGTVQDITEQVIAEQALIAARDEAEEANRAKSQFLSSMSHELRTPMNAILGFGQLLEMDVLHAEQLDYVQEILKAGHHLLELINEVLDLAKIESGRLELSIESVCFGDTLAECLSLIGPMLAKHQVTLEHDELACRQIHVLADNVRLKQVLINLLSNAIKYNHPDGNIKIECRPTPDGSAIQVSIIDTGIGISPKAQTQLFKPFTRIDDKNNNIEGTGIGLVITKNLLNLMDGDIGVESQLGMGSTFWFTLPIATAQNITVDHTRDRVNSETSTALTNSHKQYTILYIEDNPTNLRLVQQVLSRWPHIQLLAAHEPNLGLDLIRAHQPDLVLLDINLPEIDGYEVFKRMQSVPECGGIPVVAVSANAMPRDIERGLEAGFNDYITKPIQVASFLTSIANILELPPDKVKSY